VGGRKGVKRTQQTNKNGKGIKGEGMQSMKVIKERNKVGEA
jgi:hypothetical protein